MIIDPGQSSSRDLYALLISTVVPRPIAWVSTLSPEGVVNLAPFSFFQAIGADPPMLSFAVGPRSRGDGSHGPKDTLRNIEATGEFVVNVATLPNVDAVNQSSASYPPEVSEVEELGLTTLASDLVAPPRIAASPVHFECKLERVLMLGRERAQGLVIGEIVRFHVADALWDADARAVDITRLEPLARLGGPLFAGVGALVSRPRPA